MPRHRTEANCKVNRTVRVRVCLIFRLSIDYLYHQHPEVSILSSCVSRLGSVCDMRCQSIPACNEADIPGVFTNVFVGNFSFFYSFLVYVREVRVPKVKRRTGARGHQAWEMISKALEGGFDRVNVVDPKTYRKRTKGRAVRDKCFCFSRDGCD